MNFSFCWPSDSEDSSSSVHSSEDFVIDILDLVDLVVLHRFILGPSIKTATLCN